MNAAAIVMAERQDSEKLTRQSQAARKRLLAKVARLQRLMAAEEKYRERLEGTRVRST